MTRPCVLVVEDERVVAKDLQRTLAALGYDVPATAASADEALRLATLHRPDLVLMDIRIEGEPDGIEAARRIRGALGVPVVFLTAYADRETLARAKAADPFGYLVKPVQADELRSTVEIALHGSDLARRLRERERWLSTVLDAIADAVISLDAAGRIEGLNAAAERLLGVAARDATGRRLAELASLPAVEVAARERRAVRIDDARIGADTEVAGTASPIGGEDGAASGTVVVLRDVTEKRRLRRQLELADRLGALGTLAAGVAHEINNPLAWVVLNVELAQQALGEHRADLPAAPWVEKIASGLGDARLGAERVSKIVADLRRFAAQPTGERRRADVPAVLAWALEVTRAELAPRARVRATMAGDLPQVELDDTRLGQVFINLLVNAAHAIGEGDPAAHEVAVDARVAADGRVCVEVRDTGSGMSEEVRRRVFEPFFTTKALARGTGLGLSIAHGIVTGAGGEIQVESRPGAGSTFRVLLPRAPEAAPPAPPRAVAPRRSGDLLIVDDEPLLRHAVGRYLAAAGHRVTEAAGGAEALALIASGRRFDVILCDLMMPGVSGMELHARLERSAPEQARRLLFMTGAVSNASVASFLAAIPNPWLEKPFDPGALVQLLETQLVALGSEAP